MSASIYIPPPNMPAFRLGYHDWPTEPHGTDEGPEQWALIAQHAEAKCEELFTILLSIALTGCEDGACVNSLEVCREMRRQAAHAVLLHGRLAPPASPEDAP